MAVRLFNEDDWKRLSDENRELYEDYLLELEANGKSPKTIQQYAFDLRAFFCWLVREKTENIF